MKKAQRLLFVIAVSICCITNNMQAQKSININDTQSAGHQKSISSEIMSHFKDAERYRIFSYNPELQELNHSNISDTILLDFFDNKKYKAVIRNITIEKNGVTAITSQIENTKFGYCFISISDKGILISTELPEVDEQFDAIQIKGQTYLSQQKISVAKEKELICSEPIIADSSTNTLLANANRIMLQSNDIEEPITIDVMIAYTEAAKKWASTYSSGIDNVIAIAMEKANLTMQNSGTGITFNLVYKYQTDYVETDSNLDLRRFQQKDDGYLDEVHILREQYKADLIVLIPMVSFTGGVAYLLTDENGNKDLCSFSLTRVQQAATGYTLVHEIGHNMGCHHHKEQNYQAGPGLYNYSAGWRGAELGGYTTIMAYEPGTYYSDNRTYPRIPYFSSPDIYINGVTIGHTDDANNVLTLKKTKHVTSQYTMRGKPIRLSISNNSKTYGENDPDLTYNIMEGDLQSGDKIQLERQEGEDAGTYPITIKILRDNDDVTSEYDIFTSETKQFTINTRNLTLKLDNQTIVYSGKTIYADPVVIEGLIEDDKVDILYTYRRGNDKIGTSYALKAGEYVVTAKASGNPNYNETSIDGILKVIYDFNDVAKVKWNNTLMLKVAKITKDGLKVSRCQWYKNGSIISGATNFSYSAGPENTDLLDGTALYSVEIKTTDSKINSTQQQIKLKSFDVKVYPNPLKSNQAAYLEADIDEDLLDGATAEVYNMSGIRIKTIPIHEHITPLYLPDEKGTYIIKFKCKDGFNKELKAIIK